MEALARWLSVRPVAWLVVGATLLLGALSMKPALSLRQDDDLLAFLPAENPAVTRFHDINRRFGGLDVALVGVEAGDAFDGAFLERLARVTRLLEEEPAIAHALSLTSAEDFSADPRGGIQRHHVVGEPPKSAEEKAKLAARVMSRDHVVGELVSADGRSVMIYCFLTSEADPREASEIIRRHVSEAFPGEKLYWGGAPFISSYIYELTQADMRRLIPWAVGVIMLLIVASFRDVVGALLALFSTGLSVLLARGAMSVAGVDENIVLSAMPVILFAVGSAYPVHLLVSYYDLAQRQSCPDALAGALRRTGPLIVATALTTAAGIGSFMVMDIEPIRRFGLFSALGIVAAMVLALTFVPAVIRLAELRGRSFDESILSRAMVQLVAAVGRRRVGFGVVAGLVCAVGAVFVGRVEARMESRSFFHEGSPPLAAEQFMSAHFGGSQFVQLMVEGDMEDPGVLREVQRLADRIAREPEVSSVQHVGLVFSLANEAFSGERRLPETVAQVRQVYELLKNQVALRQLVTPQHDAALLQIKLRSDDYEAVTALLARIERNFLPQVPARYRIVGRLPAAEQSGETSPVALAASDAPAAAAWRRELVAARIEAEIARRGAELSGEKRVALRRFLEAPVGEADPARVEARIAAYLASDESILEPEQRGVAEPVARAVVPLGAGAKVDALERSIATALTTAMPDGGDEDDDDAGELAGDLAHTLPAPLAEIWRGDLARARTEALVPLLFEAPLEGDEGERLRTGVQAALIDLDGDAALLPAGDDGQADGTLSAAMSGTPVIYRGVAESVSTNQLASLGASIGLTLLILAIYFRSLGTGLLAGVPTVVALVLVYGTMGVAGVRLDIGTSMLASIIVGNAVDYTVHLLGAWHGKADEPLAEVAARAAARSGPGIATQVAMVAAGFLVLTLGDAKPLQNVARLTALGLTTAALSAFVTIAVVGRYIRYRAGTEPQSRPALPLVDEQPRA